MVDCRISSSEGRPSYYATNLEQEANDRARISVRREACHQREEPGRPLASQLAGRWLDCLPLLGFEQK